MSEIGLIRGLELPDPPGTIRSLEVARGTPGASAYEIWKAQGNTGTEAQFLAGLKGAASTVPGPQGLSAYQVWLAAGNTGTQADFLNSLRGASGTGSVSSQPRGTGGTAQRMTTRTPGTFTRSDLLPGSPLGAFDEELLAFIDADNIARGPGETGRVTTEAGFAAGRTYYLDTPSGTGKTNATAVPDPVPAGWPVDGSAVLNTSRPYLAIGSVSSDNGVLYLTRSAGLVQLGLIAAGGRMNIAAFPYNTGLVTGGQLVRLLQVAGADAASTVLLADNEAGVPAGAAVSPVKRTVNGAEVGVFVRVQPFGAYDLLYVPGIAQALEVELLMQFQTSDPNFDVPLPSIWFGGSGSSTTGAAGVHHAVQGYGGSMILHKIVTSGRTITSDTGIGSPAPITWSANELWNFRVRIEADKKVYARAYKEGATESATWQLNGVTAPDLVAGLFGFRFKNAYNRVHRFAWALGGGTATYA